MQAQRSRGAGYIISICFLVVSVLSIGIMLPEFIQLQTPRSITYITIVFIGSILLLFSQYIQSLRLSTLHVFLLFVWGTIGLACSLLVVNEEGAGNYAWDIFRGYPFSWLVGRIILPEYMPLEMIRAYVASHTQDISWQINTNALIASSIFFVHVGLLIVMIAMLAARITNKGSGKVPHKPLQQKQQKNVQPQPKL